MYENWGKRGIVIACRTGLGDASILYVVIEERMVSSNLGVMIYHLIAGS